MTQGFAGTDSVEWDPSSLTPAVRITGGLAPKGRFGILFGGILEMEIPGWHGSSDSSFRIAPRPYVGIQFGNPGHRGQDKPAGAWDEVDWEKKAEEWEKKAEEWAERFEEKDE